MGSSIPIPLPTFDGRLTSSFSLFESRLRCWFRVSDTPDEETKRDILILCLKDTASIWFDRQENAKKRDFEMSLALLKSKYGTRNRMLTERKTSANKLELRRFRDEKHEEEMVEHLIDDLDDMMIRAGIEDDGIKKDLLLSCFREYSGAQKMLGQAQTFDEAVIQAIKWEHNVIQKRPKPILTNRDPNGQSSFISTAPSSRSQDLVHGFTKASNSANPNKESLTIKDALSSSVVPGHKRASTSNISDESRRTRSLDDKRNSFSYLSMMATERDPDSPTNFLSLDGDASTSRRTSSKVDSGSSKLRHRLSSSDVIASPSAPHLPHRSANPKSGDQELDQPLPSGYLSISLRDSMMSYSGSKDPHPFSVVRDSSHSDLSSPALSRVSTNEDVPPRTHQMQRKLSENTYRNNNVHQSIDISSGQMLDERDMRSPQSSSTIRDTHFPTSPFHSHKSSQSHVNPLQEPRLSYGSHRHDTMLRSSLLYSAEDLGGDREVLSSARHSRVEGFTGWRHSLSMSVDREDQDDITDLVSSQGTPRRRTLFKKAASQRASGFVEQDVSFSIDHDQQSKHSGISRIFKFRGNH